MPVHRVHGRSGAAAGAHVRVRVSCPKFLQIVLLHQFQGISLFTLIFNPRYPRSTRYRNIRSITPVRLCCFAVSTRDNRAVRQTQLPRQYLPAADRAAHHGREVTETNAQWLHQRLRGTAAASIEPTSVGQLFRSRGSVAGCLCRVDIRVRDSSRGAKTSRRARRNYPPPTINNYVFSFLFVFFCSYSPVTFLGFVFCVWIVYVIARAALQHYFPSATSASRANSNTFPANR